LFCAEIDELRSIPATKSNRCLTEGLYKGLVIFILKLYLTKSKVFELSEYFSF
jgi:hypothetical protein